MATRKTSFANGEFYHVYNRGVDKRNIFIDRADVQRFFKGMLEFNTALPIGSLYEHSFQQLGGETAKSEKEKLVNIIAYRLNPNHFHFILEQVVEGGVSEFMKRIGGYTWYFNNKHKRSGALFQGVFKDIHIDSNEYLLHLSAYVNLNDRVHQLGGETAKLVEGMSSWSEYTEKGVEGICEKEIVLGQFKNAVEYKKFALSSLESIVERKVDLKNLEALLLE